MTTFSEPFGKLRANGGDGRRRVVQVHAGDLGHVGAVERGQPGQHLVHHDAQRVDVRAGVDRLAADLLGRHVSGAADDRPGARDPGPVGAGGDAEVGDLGVTVAVDEDVLRFDVAVDDARQMRGRQTLGDLPRDAAELAQAQEALADQLLERAPLDVLEDEVVVVVAGAPVDERDHVGMRELRQRPAFAIEPRPGTRVLVQRRLEPFDGYVPLELRVPGLVYDAHPPATQDPAQAVSVFQERSPTAFFAVFRHRQVKKAPGSWTPTVRDIIIDLATQ